MNINTQEIPFTPNIDEILKSGLIQFPTKPGKQYLAFDSEKIYNLAQNFFNEKKLNFRPSARKYTMEIYEDGLLHINNIEKKVISLNTSDLLACLKLNYGKKCEDIAGVLFFKKRYHLEAALVLFEKLKVDCSFDTYTILNEKTFYIPQNGVDVIRKEETIEINEIDLIEKHKYFYTLSVINKINHYIESVINTYLVKTPKNYPSQNYKNIITIKSTFSYNLSLENLSKKPVCRSLSDLEVTYILNKIDFKNIPYLAPSFELIKNEENNLISASVDRASFAVGYDNSKDINLNYSEESIENIRSFAECRKNLRIIGAAARQSTMLPPEVWYGIGYWTAMGYDDNEKNTKKLLDQFMISKPTVSPTNQAALNFLKQEP